MYIVGAPSHIFLAVVVYLQPQCWYTMTSQYDPVPKHPHTDLLARHDNCASSFLKSQGRTKSI